MQAFTRFRNKQKIDKVNKIEKKDNQFFYNFRIITALRNQNNNIILFIQYID